MVFLKLTMESFLFLFDSLIQRLMTFSCFCLHFLPWTSIKESRNRWSFRLILSSLIWTINYLIQIGLKGILAVVVHWLSVNHTKENILKTCFFFNHQLTVWNICSLTSFFTSSLWAIFLRINNLKIKPSTTVQFFYCFIYHLQPKQYSKHIETVKLTLDSWKNYLHWLNWNVDELTNI